MNFYSSYLSTYLERDVRQIQSVHDLNLFQAFMQLLAARAGSLLNLNMVAKEAGISFMTAKRWLSLLEATRIIYLLQPYFRKISKRVVKSPKLYFTDTGLLCYLLKYKDADTLGSGPMAGPIFENMLIIDQLKRQFNHGEINQLYFFRDSNGNEVDLMLDKGQEVELIEIKSSKTIRAEFTKSLIHVSNNFPKFKGYVLSMSPTALYLTKEIQALPWWQY